MISKALARRILCAFAAVVLCMQCLRAEICPLIVTANDSGFYDSIFAAHDPQNEVYLAGGFDGREFRNFFTFDIPAFSQTVTGAELRVFTYVLEGGQETYELHQVTTAVSTLRAGGSGLTNVFQDLGDGPVYGSRPFISYETNEYVSIPLSAACIADLMATRGGAFAIGGKVTTLSADLSFELLFDHPAWISSLAVELALYMEGPQVPQITVQPVGGYPGFPLLVGNNFFLYSDACGSAPLYYQWEHGGTKVPDATNQTFNLIGLSLADAGDYRVVVSNSYGSVTSTVATLNIQALQIYAHPASVNVLAGGILSLFVGVYSVLPVEYHWFKNGEALAESSSSYFKLSVSTNDAGAYFVVVRNSAGTATSQVATVTVTVVPPSITNQPVSQIVPPGANVQFTALADGAPAPVLRWFFNDTPLPIASGATLSLGNVDQTRAGSYFAVASNVGGFATSLVATLSIRSPGPLDRWHLRNPLPHPADLQDVTLANGALVAVGEHGIVLNSTNGFDWEFHRAKTDAGLLDVAYGNGVLVAVDGQSINVSSNGRDWSLIYNPTGLTSVAFGQGLFVGVRGASSSEFVGSTNGRDWFATGTAQVGGPAHLAYGNGRFVVGGQNGFAVSTNGTNWTYTFYQPIDCVSYINGRFVGLLQFAASGTVFATFSTNGINWTDYNTRISSRMLAVAYGNGLYVAVGVQGDFMFSSDGIMWTQGSLFSNDDLEAVIFSNGKFIAVGEHGTIITSSNGAVWTDLRRGPVYDLDCATAGGERLLAFGENPSFVLSTSGSNYTELPLPNVDNFHGAIYAANKFVAVGKDSAIILSGDGTNWISATPVDSTGVYFKSVLYAKNLFVTVAAEGRIYTSADAVNWVSQISPTYLDLNDVAYGNGRFVVVGDGDSAGNPGSTTLTSPNGTNWTLLSSISAKNLRAVTFADGRFVAVGNDRTILVSVDGLSWSARNTALATGHDNLRSILYTNGIWLAVGNNGVVLSSFDTINWTQHPVPVFGNLHSVCYINGAFVAVGATGTIIQSDPIASRLALLRRPGEVELTIYPGLGDRFMLQKSSDLIHWTDLTIFTSPRMPPTFVEPTSTDQVRFYRVVAQ